MHVERQDLYAEIWRAIVQCVQTVNCKHSATIAVGDNDTSVTRGSVIKKAERLDSYGAILLIVT